MGVDIIGTGHVIERSVEDVKGIIFDRRPDIVAVELDLKRFKIMEESSWTLEYPEGGGVWWGGSLPVFIERLLALIQKDLGDALGVKPGAEMAAAVLFAKELGCVVSPIDRDIEITMNHLLNVSFKEKIKMLTAEGPDLGVFRGVLCGTNIDAILEEENIKKIMGYMRETLPGIYSALVDERDRYMANSLSRLKETHPGKKIVAVVGAAHVEGISRYLREIDGGGKVDLMPLRRIYPLSFIHSFLFLFIVLLAYVLMKFSSVTRKFMK